MIILNLETSTDACSASLTENGEVLIVGDEALCRLHADHSEHARELGLFVEELLRALRSTGKQVDAVAVSAGPGSYTGLRIGASTAKGLAYGLNVPLLPVNTLRIMAAAADDLTPCMIEENALYCPMIDARRMEVYMGLYKQDKLEEVKAAEAVVVDEHTFDELLHDHVVYFLGNGAEKCKAVVKHPNARFIDGIVPDAAAMGALAEEVYRQEQRVDVAYWTPFYLKEFEAKVSHVKGLN